MFNVFIVFIYIYVNIVDEVIFIGVKGIGFCVEELRIYR